MINKIKGFLISVIIMGIILLSTDLTPPAILGVALIFLVLALLFIILLLKHINLKTLPIFTRLALGITLSSILLVFLFLYLSLTYASFHYTKYTEVEGKKYIVVPTTGWNNQFILRKVKGIEVKKTPDYIKSCTLSFNLETVTVGECHVGNYNPNQIEDPATKFTKFIKAVDEATSNKEEPNKALKPTPSLPEGPVENDRDNTQEDNYAISEGYSGLESYPNEKNIYSTIPGEIYYKDGKRAVSNMGKAGNVDMVGVFTIREENDWKLNGYVPNARGVFNFYETDKDYFILAYNASDDKITFNFSKDGGLSWKLTQIEPTERRNYAVTSLYKEKNKLCITTGADPWSTQKIPVSTYCSYDDGETWE